MPLYTFYCDCGRTCEHVLAIEERNQNINCICGKSMSRQTVYAPLVKGDLPGYHCPVTGRWIEGRRQHEENLKRHGCRIIEAGETEGVRKRRRHDEERLIKSVSETVEAEIHNMEPRKREKLAAELEAGMTAEVVRGTPTNP